jgi:hypothetical protein
MDSGVEKDLRGEPIEEVTVGSVNRNIVRLATQHPCGLFYGQPGRRLSNQRQKLMLLMTFESQNPSAGRSRNSNSTR